MHSEVPNIDLPLKLFCYGAYCLYCDFTNKNTQNPQMNASSGKWRDTTYKETILCVSLSFYCKFRIKYSPQKHAFSAPVFRVKGLILQMLARRCSSFCCLRLASVELCPVVSVNMSEPKAYIVCLINI